MVADIPSIRRRVLRRPDVHEEEDELQNGRLLRPAASCPRCGARPAMRVTEAMVRAVKRHDTATRMGTYQCQRRGCGAVYDLLASAYLRAS